ncbi:MAG: hypothetical protein ACK5NB_07735 [Flavobacteriaceae bacterium]
MPKFNLIFLTFALSFCTTFLFGQEADYLAPTNDNTPKHDFKLEHSLNALAVSVNNTFEETVDFHPEKTPTSQNPFTASAAYQTVCKTELKACVKASKLLNLSAAVRVLIYPFHSFL